MAQNKLTQLTVNALTGVSEVSDLSEQQLEEIQIAALESLVNQEALDAKIAARESALAKLAALGLTETEIAAL